MNIRGFTLLETLIYIALFGVLMTGTLVTVYELLLSFEHNSRAIAIQEEGIFLQRKINWALVGATTVSIPNASTLIITRPDLFTQSPLTVRVNGGKAYLKREDSNETVLTGEGFLVTDVHITTISAQSNTPTHVRITYTINDVPFVYETYLHF